MAKKAILCVDDEPIILEGLEAQLKMNFGRQFLYEFTESAQEALDLIQELVKENVKILIIVSDWLMPGIKGDEFLIQIHEQYPEIHLILLTGQAEETTIQRVKKQADLHQVLHKPWEEEDLIQAVQSALGEAPTGF